MKRAFARCGAGLTLRRAQGKLTVAFRVGTGERRIVELTVEVPAVDPQSSQIDWIYMRDSKLRTLPFAFRK